MAKILIANSNEAAQKRFMETLDPEGYALVLCEDGDSAQREIAQDLPDLVLTDVDLPGMDAFEMVQLLQDAVGGKGVPVIVVHSDLPDEEDGPSPEVKPSGFTWMGLSARPEDLRTMVRARLTAGEVGVTQGTILVVDDDVNIREPLEKRLEMEGYRVMTAVDGEEGLQRLEEDPDLVLLDVDMPRLDGFGVLERMRAEPRYRDMPVIVMTAHARSATEASQGLGLGASDYVRKPFDFQELLARVQTQLRIREIHRLMVEKQRDLAIIELAGAAAHEINNPLAVVMARLELILDSLDGSEPIHKDLEQVERLVHRIAGVVQKMSQVRRYQVQNYCGGVNILDLEGASDADAEGS